jgi:5'-nucleotidase
MRVGLDVDEVLLRLHELWISLYNEDYDDSLTVDDIVHWDIHEIVKPECGIKIFNYLQPWMYEKDLIQPYPLARMAVGQIRQHGHSIAFVTSCGPNNEMAESKEAYLRRHGFMKRGDLFIPGSDKSNAPVDVLVDDHIKNVETFNGPAVLVNRPHNIRFETQRLRVDSLAEFAARLLDY